MKAEKPAEVSERRKSEIEKLVCRFRVGGKERNHVENIAKNFLIPLLKVIGNIKLPEEATSIFDSFRPMEKEDIKINEAARKMKVYRKEVLAKEEKITTDYIVKTDIAFYLEGQTVAILKPVIKHLMSTTVTPKLYNSKTKPIIMVALIEKLTATSPGNEIKEFQDICNQFEPPIIPKLINLQTNKEKPIERKFKDVLESSPDETTSIALISKLAWPADVKFPL